jgi:hypothetical protein
MLISELFSKSVELTTRDESCKRIKDPIESDAYHLEAFLPFTEAVKLHPGNANVRPPSTHNRAWADMVETVEESPETFHIKNRGITYFCERFQLDQAKKRITVTLPDTDDDDEEDDRKYGIADGGHTFAIIKATVARMHELGGRDGWREPFVRVHFVVRGPSFGATDEEIVYALNTSAQVQEHTMAEFTGQYEELKQALESGGFDTSLIAFRENELRDWKIQEIIQRLACFLERWQTTQPASMYKSKGKALALYRNEESRVQFQRLYDVIVDVITLPEFIQSQFSTAGLVQLRSFSKLRVVTTLNRPWTRPGTPWETNHRMDLAASLPIAAAFRELLVLDGERYAWRVDPKEVFRNCAEKLYEVLNRNCGKIRTSSQLGSNMDYWSSLVPIVMREAGRIIDSVKA